MDETEAVNHRSRRQKKKLRQPQDRRVARESGALSGMRQAATAEGRQRHRRMEDDRRRNNAAAVQVEDAFQEWRWERVNRRRQRLDLNLEGWGPP
ncbi:hypothetical protein PIB30_081835 [Stylosanthes scabra]|uniref:Uncharacterized protein n=1 Tax=Stylosanthes scabra TaxID=79078 RepID=A0ABU6RS34_9FABA|nr:hypothetical protein [Stylosanthes scabra]